MYRLGPQVYDPEISTTHDIHLLTEWDDELQVVGWIEIWHCLLYTSPSPRDS